MAGDGSVPDRLARRASALVLLDQGMSCSDVARVPFLDDDTIRTWYRLYQQDGFDGLVSFGYDGSACRLSETQKDQLKAWITETRRWCTWPVRGELTPSLELLRDDRLATDGILAPGLQHPVRHSHADGSLGLLADKAAGS